MRTRITRKVGMQLHMIPTFISMVDQFITSAWSQVGLLEAAKCTRD